VIVKASNFSSPIPMRVQNAKVLHVINGEHYSGAERVQDLLGLQLPAVGFDVGFLCLKSGLFERHRRATTCPLETVEMTSKFDTRPKRRAIEMIRRDGYSMIHAHTPRSLLIAAGAAKATGIPLIYHVHSPVGRDSKRWLANKLNTFVENWSLRSASRMICVSQSLGRYMQSLGHPAEKLVVVPNGVPVVDTPPIPRPTAEFVLGMVALFRPRKGTEILLEGIADLKSRGRRVELLAVGPFETPAYEAEIMRLVDGFEIKDQITWTGFTNDVTSYLQKMHAMVLPSLFGEGLPMVVLEAMAAGLPVLASRVEGIPEAIRDGQDGLLFDPANPQQLADCVEQMMGDTDRWEAMAHSARQRHRECLSDIAMAEKIAAVYRSLG
jgi:glycosyltransferase involved in cell wall biosynthesis